MSETATTDRAGSAGKGLRWGLVARVATRIASFGMGLVLARLLAPADFGIYAVALAAQQFLWHINDAGIVTAIVQWRGRLDEVLPTATTMVLTFSLVVYGVLWGAAPAFAGFAGNAEAAGMVRVMALLIVIDGFVGVRSAILLRTFQQGRIAVATMVGVAVQVPVAIGFAAAGAGPYSFAFGAIASTGVGGVLMIRWARTPIRFGLRREVVVRLLRFGLPLALGLGVEALLLNADSVIVGKVFGGTILGYYLLALNVSNWVPGLIGEALRHVTLPGFSRVADERPADLSAKVRQIVPMLLIVVTPVAVLIAVLAPVLVPFLYGERWLPASAALSFLMVLMSVRMLMNICSDVLASLGAVGSIALLKVVWAVVLIPSLYLGAQLDGIRGVAVAHAGVGVVVALSLAVLLLRRAGIVLGPIVPAAARPLLGGAAAGLVAWLVAATTEGSFALVQLGVAGTAGLIAYVVVGISRARFREIRTLVQS